MNFKASPELRDAFTQECERRDLTAAQVLRGFMRDFVAGRAYPTFTPQDDAAEDGPAS